jgi:hypothetical protein
MFEDNFDDLTVANVEISPQPETFSGQIENEAWDSLRVTVEIYDYAGIRGDSARLSLLPKRSNLEGKGGLGNCFGWAGGKQKKRAAPTRRGPTKCLPLVLFLGFRFVRLALS